MAEHVLCAGSGTDSSEPAWGGGRLLTQEAPWRRSLGDSRVGGASFPAEGAVLETWKPARHSEVGLAGYAWQEPEEERGVKTCRKLGSEQINDTDFVWKCVRILSSKNSVSQEAYIYIKSAHTMLH